MVMFSPGRHVILNFVAFLYLAKGNALFKDEGAKGFERDFQICMDNFVVNTDIIIKTQDSRKLGAKFLNDMDVESRHDCKRFCCETDMCDVFIYEKKKPGGCYLFHCGPPHDFKCKFTNHSSYSSAILNIVNPQQTLQIEEQIRRIKQEHELKSLRRMPESPALEYPINEATPMATQMPKILTTLIANKTVCSRNQYECKSTRECIAIYNVCDGIPQCADGSDESADLGCPSEKPTPPPQPLLPRPLLPVVPEMSNYQQMVPHHKSYAPMYQHVLDEDNAKPWQSQNSAHQMVPQQQNIQYPIDRVMLSQPQMNIGYPRYQWNYPPYFDPNKEPYNNMNIPHGQNKMLSYEQGEPRIFHHKRPGVTNENEDRSSYETKPYVPYYMPPNRENWPDGQQVRMEPQVERQPEPKVDPQMEHDEVLPAEPHENPVEPKPELRPQVQPEVKPKVKSKPPAKPQAEPQPESYHAQKIEPHPTVAPEIVATEINKPTKVLDNQEESSTPKKVKSENKVNESQKVKPEIPESKETKASELKKKEKVESSKKKEEIHHEPSHKKAEEKATSIAEHFRLENDQVEKMRPKGAIISLALGLTVTAIMAVLIACRLRVVRRRGRRRHEPYAHDADYLVNGMYL